MAALSVVSAGPFVVQAPDGQVFRFDTSLMPPDSTQDALAWAWASSIRRHTSMQDSLAARASSPLTRQHLQDQRTCRV